MFKHVNEREFWLEFINKYHALPCLWDTTIKDYTNKAMREDALALLVEMCKDVNIDADKDYIRKRIANFRTAFRREFKKMKCSGTGPDGMYKYHSNLWYFDHLLFLKEGGTGDISMNDDDSFSEDYFTSASTMVESKYEPQTKYEPTTEEAASTSTTTQQPTPVVQKPIRKKPSNIKGRKIFSNSLRFLTRESVPNKQTRNDDGDEYELFGKRIAAHFRNMEGNQRLLAEKIISDVCINARLCTLTKDSCLNLAPTNLHNQFAFNLPTAPATQPPTTRPRSPITENGDYINSNPYYQSVLPHGIYNAAEEERKHPSDNVQH